MASVSQKTIREKVNIVYDVIDRYVPEKIIFLKESEDWKFLFLVILSAQCTDKKVMQIKDSLFTSFPTLEDFANAEISEIESKIKTLGLYKNKAKNLKSAAIVLMEKFNGRVPNDFESLTSLPGVGRKTANCVRGEVFGLSAVICDTHFIRLSNRLGFVQTQDPLKVEKFYLQYLKPEKQYRFSMAANFFARNICKAQSPQCTGCPLQEYCVLKSS